MMIGAAGVGKTAYWLYPNIEYACASGMSFMSTDTKGDIMRNYGSIASKYYGYNISVIDLRNPMRSHGNNLLHLVNKYMDLYAEHPETIAYKAKAEKYAKIISKTIILSGMDAGSFGQNAYFYDAAEGAIADKMFIDAPLNIKKVIEDKNYNSTYLAVEKTINMLKDNGTAIVVVPGSLLFGMTKTQIEQRRKLLDNKWLQAVIALPPCFYSAGVGVNLLLISKTNNENVLFINASNNGVMTFSEKDRRNNILTTEGISTIAQIIENGEEILGISKFCSAEEIAEMNYDLTPAKYISIQRQW